MEMTRQVSRIIPIHASDSSQTGNARRQALSLADAMGFDELRHGQLGIIVTEAARNIEAHAGNGEIVLSPWFGGPGFGGPGFGGIGTDGQEGHQDSKGIDVLALDKGKGIENVAVSLQDGYSTGNTPGNGLGAMSRLAATFQIYSSAGHGTAVFARVLAQADQIESDSEAYATSAINLPLAGESVCGDAWAVHRTSGRTLYIVADGLGHGPFAAEAAQEALRIFELSARHAPERILADVHGALAHTRGAAVSVAEILHEKRLLNYAGAGNIVAAICLGNKSRSLVSMNGTVGHSIGRIQQFSYPWEKDSVLVMHSDGLATRWNFDQYQGLTSRHPALMAGVLFRDFSRRRDDATIVVARM
jgi:anti-sigma regulatory factor (Ser/Thr protein kinase)